MKYIYVDTETTGVDPKKNAIIQLAGTIVANGVSEDFNWIIQPHLGALVEPAAMAKNGITEEQLRTAKSSEKVFEEFTALLNKHVNKFDRNDKFAFIGYNANFDMDFMRAWFLRNNEEYFGSFFIYPSYDVMQLAAWFTIGKRTSFKDFKLGTVYEALLGKPLIDAHDAAADIAATREIMNYIFANLMK